MFLVIFKQPGANVIDTVDSIKAQLPRLTATLPAGIKIGILSDRTQTIRASVEDVQFTLLITIVLVVAVIFVFLRSFWATVIPSVTVPLALLGACALMWLAGYTLDNLSLMALTISVASWSTTPSSCWRISAVRRGGDAAHGGRVQGRRARSASPSCRSRCR